MMGLHLRLPNSHRGKSARSLWDHFLSKVAGQQSYSSMAKVWTLFFLVSVYPKKPEPWGDRQVEMPL